MVDGFLIPATYYLALFMAFIAVTWATGLTFAISWLFAKDLWDRCRAKASWRKREPMRTYGPLRAVPPTMDVRVQTGEGVSVREVEEALYDIIEDAMNG